MIIKSYRRGDHRQAIDYFKVRGTNERTRLVDCSDIDADSVESAFFNMWKMACLKKAWKTLHHIIIVPEPSETYTDEIMFKIFEEAKKHYGYKPGHHQHIIIEHIKYGRQHFHILVNKVDLLSGKTVQSNMDYWRSHAAAREMEVQLGLQKCPMKFKEQLKRFRSRRDIVEEIGHDIRPSLNRDLTNRIDHVFTLETASTEEMRVSRSEESEGALSSVLEPKLPVPERPRSADLSLAGARRHRRQDIPNGPGTTISTGPKL